MRIIKYLFILTCFSLLGQNKQVLYGFSEIPQSLLLNPGGKTTNDWYFGIPLLSHIHLNAGSSGISAYDLFADDGLNINYKLKNAIYNLKANDFFTVNQQIEIFSGGFALGKSFEKDKYITFGLYQESDIIAYFPKDFAILASEGNQNNIDKLFDISDINARAELLSVWHVGYNKKVNDKFSFGLRGKIYSSISDINSTRNNGVFVTRAGQDNFYNHIFNIDLEIRSSGISSFIDDRSTESKYYINEFKKRTFFGGNLGLGLDIGFTQKLTDQLTIDGSLLDIGFIRHRKNIKNYKIEGTYEFEGVDPIFYNSNEGQTADDYWNAIQEDFKELFEIDSTTTKYTTMRPLKINASLNYAFGEKKTEGCSCVKENSGYLNAIGIQLYSITRPKQPQLALTTYYYRRLFKGLSAKATYTIDSYSFYNIGMGMSANIGRLNFYLMADNFLEFQNVYNIQSVSMQLGFNYIFNKNKD